MTCLARFALATSLVALLTGCSMPLPTYDTVRSEAQSAMQQIIDQLPPGTDVQPQPDGDPFGCSGGSGVFYTGQTYAFPPAGFDGQTWVDGLPAALGDDFVVRDTGLDVSFPNISLVAQTHGNALVGVSVSDVDGSPGVDITATSRCAQPPDEGATP